MPHSYIETLISKSSRMIQRWHGRPAEMLELTRGHTTLQIVIRGEDSGSNLFLACLEPTHIHGPVNWTDSHIVLEATHLESGAEGVAILDRYNDVCVVAESIEVKEHVKL